MVERSKTCVGICPHCELLCDLSIQGQSCSRRIEQAEQLDRRDHWVPLHHGNEISWEEGVELASQWLGSANFPLITGAISDISSSRSALKLASAIGAVVDPWSSDPQFAYFSVLQRNGFLQTTLNEIRHRVDTIFLLGEDSLLENYPMLPLWISNPARDQRLLLLGHWSDSARKAFEERCRDVLVYRSDLQRLPLSLLAFDLVPDQEPKILDDQKNLAILWSHSIAMLPQDYEIWLARLHDWMMRRNSHQRCAALPLGGSSTSFHQVATWLTGFPGRFRYVGNGNSTFDPSRYRAQTIVEEEQCDLIVWIDTTSKKELPHELQRSIRGNVIAMSCSPPGQDFEGLWFPMPVAGYDGDASFFRSDLGSVSCVKSTTERSHRNPLTLLYRSNR